MKEKFWSIFLCVWSVISPIFLCFGGLVFPKTLNADDFRIETKIFVEENPRHVAENLTLFFADHVYDFQLGPLGEITVFDSSRKRFILLDPVREVKTTILLQDLLQFSARMKISALQLKDALPRFAADPSFQITFDKERGQLAMTSPYLSYEIQTKKLVDVQKRRQYRRFSDSYTYLNATQPGALPVYARLEVNKELDQRERIPTHVIRTVVYRGKKKREAIRCSQPTQGVLGITQRRSCPD